SSGIVQLKQPRPFSKIEMARRNQAGHTVSKSERHWVPTHTFRREGRSAPLGAIIGMSSMLASP
ncbi:hypothetical protein, partial [Burkholderia pseudomallei]|uniref:hypothetical protein n=1 Tax=Burkholderia pseudomallei TaxID=28450 RepID=UPI001C4D46DA